MKKIDILYDHYKESNILIQNTRKDRNKYFLYLFLIMSFNLIFLIYPNEILEIFNQFLQKEYSITSSIIYVIIQSSCWLLITHLLIQYLRSSVNIERQYDYISRLENEIGKIIKTKEFDREGKDYLKDYPLILDILDFYYKRIVPVIILFLNGVKLFFEYINSVCLFLKVVDSICYVVIFFLILLYLSYLNSLSDDEKKQ